MTVKLCLNRVFAPQLSVTFSGKSLNMFGVFGVGFAGPETELSGLPSGHD
jgi:hypothetical protein